MWPVALTVLACIGFLGWLYRQGIKNAWIVVFKDEQNKTRKIHEEWDEIDADRKKQRDQIADDPDHDPGRRWE